MSENEAIEVAEEVADCVLCGTPTDVVPHFEMSRDSEKPEESGVLSVAFSEMWPCCESCHVELAKSLLESWLEGLAHEAGASR